MSSHYEWTLSRQAAERIIHFPMRKRQVMLDALDSISDQAPQDPKAAFTGSNGQNYFIVSIKQRVITYTIDHAVKRIEVIAVE